MVQVEPVTLGVPELQLNPILLAFISLFQPSPLQPHRDAPDKAVPWAKETVLSDGETVRLHEMLFGDTDPALAWCSQKAQLWAWPQGPSCAVHGQDRRSPLA